MSVGAFQTMVWASLRTILSGEVRSYQEVADASRVYFGRISRKRSMGSASAVPKRELMVVAFRSEL